MDDRKTEPVRNIIMFISASSASIKLVHHLWAFSIPQGSQYGKFIYGLLYINKYCIISYAGTTDTVWEQILSSISRLVEFNNICGHPVQLERHTIPITLNGLSSAEYINLKELQTAITTDSFIEHGCIFLWQMRVSRELQCFGSAPATFSVLHTTQWEDDSPEEFEIQGTGFYKGSSWNIHLHKMKLRCLVDRVESGVHGETKQVGHKVKYRRTATTVTQSGSFSNGKGYQHRVTSCCQTHNSSQGL